MMREDLTLKKLEEVKRTITLLRDDLDGSLSFYKRMKNKSYELIFLEKRYNKAMNFIDAVCCHAQDWDLFCDCGMPNNKHDADCMTMKMRKDQENICVDQEN